MEKEIYKIIKHPKFDNCYQIISNKGFKSQSFEEAGEKILAQTLLNELNK